MPFDDDYKDLSKEQPKPSGLKNVSSQKSIFEGQTRKPTQQEFEQRVHTIEEAKSGYKAQTADLAIQFNKMMADKTLPENKNIFAQDMEREVLKRMIRLAEVIDNDPNEEKIGTGSLSWIAVLLKTCMIQRDRINQLEYALSTITRNPALIETINKEITKALDKKKVGE
jgi:Trp operon repressor